MAWRTRGSWVTSCTSLSISQLWLSGWPAPDEVTAFEHGVAKALDALRRLRDESHPLNDFDAQPF